MSTARMVTDLDDKYLPDLTTEGTAWAIENFDLSLVARVAIGGKDWPFGHRSAAINVCNEMGGTNA